LEIQLQGATHKIIWCNPKWIKQESSLEHGTTGNLWWKSNLKQIAFYLQKVATVSRFNSNSGWIPDCWVSYKKRFFSNIELSFMNKSCLETGDLWVLGISEKCNRLTKYVGC